MRWCRNRRSKERIEEEEEIRKEEVEEQIYWDNDPVKKHQLMETGSVVMNDTHPEMECRLNDKVVSVAPGEGKTPVDFLYNHDWDVKAFPHLNNPDGGNGLFQKERPVKLTYQNFFNQRILNVNKRFSRHPPYLFSAVHNRPSGCRRERAGQLSSPWRLHCSERRQEQPFLHEEEEERASC